MAIEEFNALAAWTRRQEWPSGMPLIPKLDEKFDILLDADLRVLFRGNNLGFGYVTIIEPTTERINYDTTTAIGGMMSRLDKYGSHEYLLRTAPKGEYTLVVDRHMTDTLTIVIYKNWGRPNQSEQLIIYHPDKKWFKIVNEEASESIEDEQENEEALIIEKIQM